MSYYSLLGSILVLVGIAVLVVATMISSRGRNRDRADVKAASVILIGPIPIIFGTDTKWVIVAIILALLLVVLSFLANFR